MDLSALDRHEKIALQFSGGKDSLACLYLLKDHWDRLTVYHLDTGDAFPETREAMKAVEKLVPHFVYVRGYSPTIRQFVGIPSDIVPTSASVLARNVDGNKAPLIIDRYSCCFQSINLPMHRRMKTDGITLIIRGQKDQDRFKSQSKSGDVVAEFEFLYPVEAWTAAMVFVYLKSIDVPVLRFYETMESAPDCMSCTAWLEENRGPYLRRYHPDAFALYQSTLKMIKNEIAPYCDRLDLEIEP